MVSATGLFIGKAGVETFLNYDLPELVKISTAVAIGIIGTVGVIDGIGDVFTGVHHYLGLRAWQKLSRNQQTKDRLERRIQLLREIRNQKDPLF